MRGKAATGAVAGLANLGAAVERAGFIGDARYRSSSFCCLGVMAVQCASCMIQSSPLRRPRCVEQVGRVPLQLSQRSLSLLRLGIEPAVIKHVSLADDGGAALVC